MSTLSRKDIEAIVNQSISSDRFASYSTRGKSDAVEGMAYYLWNIALCEALYPSLDVLEVALRNQIHNVLTDQLGREDWYDMKGFLHGNELDKVKASKGKLKKRGKARKPGRIIAELNFGFWTALFGNPYEKFWYKIIKSVFPNERSISIKLVRQRLHYLKLLRNRVYHYESILGLNDLPSLNLKAQEIIGWINPDFNQIIKPMDRYEAVYDIHVRPFLEFLPTSKG